MSTAVRSERPMSRWISCVRPLTPESLSRRERVWVEAGSIAYSAVTQPLPLPLRHEETPSSIVAAHSTRVSPSSKMQLPWAWVR